MLSRWDCYELCVQSPRATVTLLRAVHGGEPLVLREDFAGTGAVSRRWVREGQRRGERWRATCIDHDADVIIDARERALAHGTLEGLTLRCDDALRAADRDGADVIYVGNFSIGEVHEEQTLRAYLRACAERLARGNAGFGGGVLAMDVSEGPGVFEPRTLTRDHRGRGIEVIRYIWRHEEGDTRSCLVTNSISFDVIRDGAVVQSLPRAFVYRWRAWSLAELRAALRDAGFGWVCVTRSAGLAEGETPVWSQEHDLHGDWTGLVVARR